MGTTFYIKFKNQPMSVIQDDAALLCETTTTFIYPGGGFRLFNKLINESPELLQDIEIFDEGKKYYTPKQFLTKIGKLKFVSFNK